MAFAPAPVADWAVRPASPDGWFVRAREVAAILARDAAERDRTGTAPHTEIQLLKAAGLVTILGDRSRGGGGQTWSTALRVCREVSKADGAIGQLLGYHYLWAWAVRFFGTSEQIDRYEELYVRSNLFFGGAINPRDKDVRVTEHGDELHLNGRKAFASGSGVSDLTCLLGTFSDGRPVFLIVDSKTPGLVYNDDWDNMGQRQTESGSVTISDLVVQRSAVLGAADNSLAATVFYSSLSLVTLQLIMTNLYQGIAEGAMEAAAEYTRTITRPWPYGGDDKGSATEEWYILEAYGDFRSKLWATEALIDQVNDELSELLHAARESVTPPQRGEVAVRISAAKQRIIKDGLEITTRIFDVMGARSTASRHGYDRFWRNLRTHSLHDPVAYKQREVGRYQLLGELPQPSFYT